MKTSLCTLLALIAFAGNSVLCRLALGDNTIDAASFTLIRLLSGIIVLALILKCTNTSSAAESKGSWTAAGLLFVYAAAFSFAYVSLDTGVGALVLFGAVQITMILAGVFGGKRLHFSECFGLVVAFLGFVYLVLPSLSLPSRTGFALMAVAGIAWGFYTLAGKRSTQPLSDTAYNFLRTLPLCVILLIFSYQDSSLSRTGVLLAIVSGGLASGLGYTVWYIALSGLSSIQAAALQLLVPPMAAIGGVWFASELFTLRLAVASIMILGGVAVVIFAKAYFVRKPHSG